MLKKEQMVRNNLGKNSKRWNHLKWAEARLWRALQDKIFKSYDMIKTAYAEKRKDTIS